MNKEFIVSERLYFQIIIEFRLFNEFLITLSGKHSPEKLTHDTGRAINEAFMIFLENRLGDKRAFPVKFQMRKGHHAIQVPKACNIFGKNDDVIVLLPIRIGIFRDFVNHVPFHAIYDFLMIFISQILNFGESLDNTMIRDSHRRMMPLCCSPDDFFIINQPIEAHLCMEMEFHPGSGIIIHMVNRMDFSFFHLLKFQTEAAGIFIKSYIPPHFDHSSRLQAFYARRFIGTVKKLFAGNAIRVIGEIHDKKFFLAAKFPYFTADHGSCKHSTV